MNNQFFFNTLQEIKIFLLNYFNTSYQTIPVCDEFHNLHGSLKDNHYFMESFAWQSNKVNYCRLTYLTEDNGKIEMLNLAMYPNPTFKSQMFVTDFVFLNKQLRVGVIDIMPVFDDILLPSQESLYQESIKISPVYERKLEWSFKFLSPYACLATQTSQDSFKNLYALWYKYFSLYQTHIYNSVATNTLEEEASKRFQNDYNKEHILVEQNRNPLKHFFGEVLMKNYFENFLFKNLFH
jgi:hypothetical protein